MSVAGGGVRPSQPFAFIQKRHDKLAILCLNDITLRVKRVFKINDPTKTFCGQNHRCFHKTICYPKLEYSQVGFLKDTDTILD
jgi:hypothetical protein